jgi:hypothetical protein
VTAILHRFLVHLYVEITATVEGESKEQVATRMGTEIGAVVHGMLPEDAGEEGSLAMYGDVRRQKAPHEQSPPQSSELN